jgi:hypothetical protein
MMEHEPVHRDAFDRDDVCDLDSLLHPSQAFDRPADVVNDPALSLNEKRASLASWASDACAVEAVPALRCPPGGKRLVAFDEVMEALRALDKQARDEASRTGSHGAQRHAARRRRSSDEGEGFSLG